jgi:phosphinothricin acetyltransferase
MTDSSVTIRAVTGEDAARIAEIYNWYIENTSYTFEQQTLTVEQAAERLQKASERHPWLVLERQGRVDGFAYAGEFRTRAAYRQSLETTVYLDQACRGGGLGMRLYESLFGLLRQTDAHVAVAVIALPNPRSVALHEKLGFVKVGHLAEIGRKFDQWVDTGYWLLRLRGHVDVDRDS